LCSDPDQEYIYFIVTDLGGLWAIKWAWQTTGFRGLWALEWAWHMGFRGLWALKWAWQINFVSSMKIVGVTGFADCGRKVGVANFFWVCGR